MIEHDIMAHIMAKPMKPVELHYLMIQFLNEMLYPTCQFFGENFHLEARVYTEKIQVTGEIFHGALANSVIYRLY